MEKRIYTCDRETWTHIEYVESLAEGMELIRKYEEEDRKNDCYEPDFYDVVVEGEGSLLY